MLAQLYSFYSSEDMDSNKESPGLTWKEGKKSFNENRYIVFKMFFVRAN